MFVDGAVRNVKVVYLGSNLALIASQFEAVVRRVGQANAAVHTLPETEDGERLQLVQVTWPEKRSRTSHSTRLWLYQVPTNPLYMFTRMQLFRGADVLVVCVDGRSPVDQSTFWVEELRMHHASPLHEEVPPRVVIQYVCPPHATVNATALERAVDADGEFVALVFNTEDPEQLATRTMEWIASALPATT